MSDITFHCREATPQETEHTILQLRAHSEAIIGQPVMHEPFAIIASQNNTLVGSIIGKIYFGWMHLDLVWVSEALRRNGIGGQMLQYSIAEAEKRNLKGIEVWTQSWQAPTFYTRFGFKELAALDDFIEGQKRHIMRYILKEHRL